jgi:threonine dehydrogenase-like Zn-dependent dehydrogenase
MDLYTHVQKSDQEIVGCGKPHWEDHPFSTDESNIEAIFRMMRGGMIRTEPLITHRVSFQEGPAVYQMLMNEKDKAIGVQFDWSEA